MKNKIIGILILIVLVLSIILVSTFSSLKRNKENASRWENNYNESKKEVQRIELTLEEFKEQASEKEDSLLKLLDIKPKQVERIIYVENKIEVKDTIKVEVEDVKKELNSFSNIYMFKKEVGCISLEGYSISVDKPEIYLTTIISNSKTSYVAYKERNKRRVLFFNTKFLAKKQTKLEVKNSCGKVKVLEIDIIKKK